MKYLLLFYGSDGYANVPHYYVYTNIAVTFTSYKVDFSANYP
jgi:hypothetical protein